MELTAIDLDWDRETSDEVLADLTPAQLKLAGVRVSVARKLATRGDLKLLMLAVEHEALENHIRHAIASDAQYRGTHCTCISDLGVSP